FFSVIAVPVYAYMQNSKVEHDLSVIGNGTATVVQVHDPGCRLCNRLKSNLGEVKGEFKDKIQFKTANILKPKGRVFASKHNVPHVTLLFFDKKGQRVNTMEGVSSSDDIKSSLQRLSKRR
ncbi:MAG: thioredoxin domain-containing protein, partial [Cocleimonas sp.]